MNYSELKNYTAASLEQFKKIANSSNIASTKASLLRNISILEQKLQTNEFSVGVVGVFNTGKSTFLNAMMGKKLLSDYILPETASITTIRYAQNPKEERAIVNYWTKEEWESIKKMAEGDRRTKKKLQRLTDEIGGKVYSYIKEEGKSEEISTHELNRYTAVNSSKSLALLVKEVEVYVPLDFCKDDISIVDTPGLNDPIQLREMITTNTYLPKCDLILFLLPANQAFTKFDQSFLEKQAKKNNIHKIFFLINRIDEVIPPKGDIQEIVNFVQENLEDTFEDLQQDVVSFEIFPMSAMQALLHRDSELAASLQKTPSWSLEETGLPAFEQRLRTFLYEGEKAKTFQKLIQGTFIQITHDHQHELESKINGLQSGLEAAQEKLQSTLILQKKLQEESLRFEKIAEETIEHFEKKYVQAAQSLRSDIIELGEAAESFALDSLDQYLATYEGQWFENIKVAYNLKEWCKNEFSVQLTDFLRDEIDDCVQHSLSKIEDAMSTLESSIQNAYLTLEERLNAVVMEHQGKGGAALLEAGIDALIGAAINAAISLAIREILLIVATYVSAEVAAILIGIGTGPIGIVILVGAGIYSLIDANSRIPNKIRTKFEDAVGPAIAEQLRSIGPKAQELLLEKQSMVVAEIRESVFVPLEAKKQQFADNIAALQETIADLKNEEGDLNSMIQDLQEEHTKTKHILDSYHQKIQS